MKKIIIVTISIFLLTACSSTLGSEFSKRMSEESATVSLITVQLSDIEIELYEAYDSPIMDKSKKINLTSTSDYIEENIRNNIFEECSETKVNEDIIIFYEKYDELQIAYSKLITNLSNPSTTSSINYNDFIVGIECKDDKLSTAYLYSNQVVKLKIDDSIEYYVLSDNEYEDWLSIYENYLDDYLYNIENCPCWRIPDLEYFESIIN
jgi:hypothetical protein